MPSSLRQNFWIVSQHRNAIPYEDYLWVEGKIPYTIAKDLGYMKKNIKKAFKDFTNNTCITFHEKKPADKDYVHFELSKKGCDSYVGRMGGKQVIHLADGCNNPGAITHEINHAIGFFHEHERSDRDEHIRIKKKNIKPGKKDQFQKMRREDNLILDKFDPNSIMLYASSFFSKNTDKLRTLETIEGREIERTLNMKLSKSDIKRINILYKCPQEDIDEY